MGSLWWFPPPSFSWPQCGSQSLWSSWFCPSPGGQPGWLGLCLSAGSPPSPSLHPCWTRGFHQVLGLRLKPPLPASGIPAPLDIRLHPQAEPLLCPPSQLLWQITSQRQDAHPALFWKLSGLLCHELTSTLQRLFTRHHPPGLTPFLGQTRPRVPFPDPTLP